MLLPLALAAALVSPARAALGPDALKKVVVKARSGDFDAQETLRTELRYYEMLEASPGMLGTDDKESLTIIRKGLGASAGVSVTSPRAQAWGEGPGDAEIADLVARIREKNVFLDRALAAAPFPRTSSFLAHDDLVSSMKEEAGLMRSLARAPDVKLSTSAAALVAPLLEVVKTFDDVEADFKGAEKDLRASASGREAKAALKALGRLPGEILADAETALAKTGPNRTLLSAFHRRASDPVVAPHVARALGRMGAKAVPALIDALAEPETCRQAILALGEIGPDAQDAAVYLVRLRDGPFAAEVAEALRKIGVSPQAAAALRVEETQTLSRADLEKTIVESAREVKALAGAYRAMITDISLLKPDDPRLAVKKRTADDLRENTYIPANDRFVSLATQYRSTYGAEALFALADANGFRDMVR